MDEESWITDSAGPDDGDRSYRAIGLELMPGRVRRLALTITAVPLALALLIALRPWTYGSGTPNVFYSYPTTGQPTGGYGGATTNGTDTSTPSPSPTGDPATQAAAVTALLTQAQSDRKNASDAVTDAAGCGNLSADSAALANAQSDHRNLAQQAQSLTVSALVSDDSLTTELTAAFTDSGDADKDYAAWVTALESSCTAASATDDPNYQAGQSASAQATQDKQTLLNLWNPIATTYGQPTWSESDI